MIHTPSIAGHSMKLSLSIHLLSMTTGISLQVPDSRHKPGCLPLEAESHQATTAVTTNGSIHDTEKNHIKPGLKKPVCHGLPSATAPLPLRPSHVRPPRQRVHSRAV
jgi:hypothetical protein